MRKDAQVAREVEIALPVELDQGQRRELVTGYLEAEFVGRGMVADVAYHGGEGHNPHAHVLLTTRQIGASGFGAKERSWNSRDLLERWRREWQEHANHALERANRPERIDHRSLAAQHREALERGDVERAMELDRDPDIHHGKSAWMMARTGKSVRVERGFEVARGNVRRERERRSLRSGIELVLDAIRREREWLSERFRDVGRKLSRPRSPGRSRSEGWTFER